METTNIGDHVYKFENSDLVEELNSAARVGEKATASAADKEKREEKSQKRMLDNTGMTREGPGGPRRNRRSMPLPGLVPRGLGDQLRGVWRRWELGTFQGLLDY